jgi:hypothetical protein
MTGTSTRFSTIAVHRTLDIDRAIDGHLGALLDIDRLLDDLLDIDRTLDDLDPGPDHGLGAGFGAGLGMPIWRSGVTRAG